MLSYRVRRGSVGGVLACWLMLGLVSGCAKTSSTAGVALPVTETQPAVATPFFPSQTPSAEPSGPSPEITDLPGGLTLEAYRLEGPPSSDPFSFQPLAGTQSDVLARRAAEREQTLAQQVTADDQFRPTLTMVLNGATVLARIDTDPATQEQTVSLYKGDQLIFTAPAGFPSPGPALQGLWGYDGHWALELLKATPDVWVGQVYVDGAMLNEQLGADEVFGFQLLDGRPFFFFAKGGRIGVSYDGQVADLGYTNIPHYECCGDSVLNPVHAQSMVAFFAEDASGWRYVEIGKFIGP